MAYLIGFVALLIAGIASLVAGSITSAGKDMGMSQAWAGALTMGGLIAAIVGALGLLAYAVA